jgi:histidyl-tRNA synthetase
LKNAVTKFLSNKNFTKGIAEIRGMFQKSKPQIQILKIQIDLTLARGLNFYTGIIFEVKAKGVQMGSVGGGGRYDDPHRIIWSVQYSRSRNIIWSGPDIR